MLFGSNGFLFLFLPVVLVGFFVLKNRIGALAAQVWLTLASIVFYGLSDWRFVPLLLASIGWNFAVGGKLAERHARALPPGALLALGIGVNLLALVYFKYSNFILENLKAVTGWPATSTGLPLPVGISFYTFTQIAYLVDAGRGEAREYELPRYALFVTFFPHLIAGPIIHHKEMMPQFAPDELRQPKFDFLPLGVTLFAIGLAKKVVLADTFAQFASPLFVSVHHGSSLDLIDAWTAALTYSFQLYFDFSGYSDMALGLALMFGIRLPVNFLSPYKSQSIIEFWRTWHMTLSRFLRDYLYFPLGGNRKGPLRRYLNLLVVMTLGGLWHGAGWTFALWGMLHGLYLMINHAWQLLVQRQIAFQIPRRRATALTFLAVVFAWVLFRADNLAAAGAIYRGMLGMNGATIAHDLIGPFGIHDTIKVLGFPISPLFFDQDRQWQGALMCLIGMAIVWGLPNSMEITGFVPWSRAAPAPTWHQRLAFSPTRNFALATGFVLFACVSAINAGAVSEFIYFRF
jgi:alginate O-acetyltransferase complex protein AlgI